MLKLSIIIFVFLVSLSGFTQTSQIDYGSWHLHNLIIDSENHFNPLNSNATPVTTDFGKYDNEDDYWFSFTICDFTGAVINYDFENSTFTVSELSTTLGGCFFNPNISSDDVLDIQRKLIGFYLEDYNFNGLFSYEIIEENLGTPKTLTIISPSGNTAIYQRTILANNQFYNTSFSIYPNPVKNELNINFNNQTNSFHFKIFDLSSKLIQQKTLQNTKLINLENLENGFYFIIIEDEFGKTGIKKFIKG
jgi:hypothetical protein